ncbi:MAG: LemA family protein [Candidatus Pacebacteria bacterium]|nr:LemA family protein [Candidatus Paceibacterota bacterium]
MALIYILLGVLGVVVIWFIASYNGFVRLVNRVKEAWADIDVQLKRRYDLIPNLVETVKGYAVHEREAFEKVTQARARALGAQTVKEKEDADNMVSSALKSIFAIAEAYPQLRAVESFTKLQDELSDTENKIQAARRFYNTNVRDLNTKIDIFPSSIVARMFNFQKQEFFELEEEAAKEPVKVKF